MCDTFVIMPNASADGSVIFGKNSDRDANEAHEVVLVPAQDHEADSHVMCTYVEIPQVRHTHAVLLLKPFWIWGAEMGANEHGVVIGNEAVFTKGLIGKDLGLIGMDFIRLALERACSAGEALDTIVTLLETYGQSGNCGYSHPMYYNNSFIIADPREAWVLETAGREWAAERVKDVRSISNAITIDSAWDRASAGLVGQAAQRGWHKGPAADFSFARAYSDFTFTTFSDAHARQVCTTGLLQTRKGQLTVTDAFDVLRSHGAQADEGWRPDASLAGADVCMHVGFGPIRVSQSVGSLVAHLGPAGNTYWVTGTSAPCTSIFKPVWFDGGVPWSGEAAPTGIFDPASLWWRHEKLHRSAVHDYANLIGDIRSDQKQLECAFWDMTLQGDGSHADVSARCYAMAEAAEARWMGHAREHGRVRSTFYYRATWKNLNREADFPA